MTIDNHAVVVTLGTAELQEELANKELASFVGGILHYMYPGYLWRVNAEIKGGVVNILCGDASMECGYTLMVTDLIHEGNAKKVIMQAGGEILERFGLSRAGFKEHEIVDAKRDLRGNIIAAV